MYSPFLRYNLVVPSVRTCVVSFHDIDGMQHAVEVNAASLYEAAVLGLKAFRSSSFVEHSLPGTNTRLKVTVRSEEATHEVAVAQVETWLCGQGKSPRERLRNGPAVGSRSWATISWRRLSEEGPPN